MSAEMHDSFQAIVRGGMLADNGMASFADLLSAEDADRIHQYIISRATTARLAQTSGD
jgi:quinohemoprotein ethanol dehydrogenase